MKSLNEKERSDVLHHGNSYWSKNPLLKKWQSAAWKLAKLHLTKSDKQQKGLYLRLTSLFSLLIHLSAICAFVTNTSVLLLRSELPQCTSSYQHAHLVYVIHVSENKPYIYTHNQYRFIKAKGENPICHSKYRWECIGDTLIFPN